MEGWLVMKIKNMKAQSSFIVTEHDSSNKKKKKNNVFSSELLANQEKYSKDKLNALLEKIDKQGARLTETPTYSELKSYRDLVRTFVNEAVSNMYSLETQHGWDRQGRQKVYTIVKKIDDTLESMTEDIRSGQERGLNIAAKQDVIRGMLVDLYM